MMTAYEMKRLLTSLGGRCCCLSATASVVASVLIVLVSSSLTQGNPLVYPNRFSFQKTSTTSTTQNPLHDHDHSNNSLTSFGNTVAGEPGIPSSYSRSFRYDIAAWVVGAVFLIGLVVVVLYPGKQRRNNMRTPSSSSCYVFPASSDMKSDIDSTSIIANTNSDSLDNR